MVDRSEVVAAALSVAQERGLSAMTMRSVAARLHVTPMTIYRHVQDKEALLDGVMGRLLSEIEVPPNEWPWSERLRAMAQEFLAVANRYPTVFPLLLTRVYRAPEAVPVVEALFRLLGDAGISGTDLPRVERLVSTAMLGYAVSASNQAFWAHDPANVSEISEAVTSSIQQSEDPPPPKARWRTELDVNVSDLVWLLGSGPPATRVEGATDAG
jgi:AcrR family transcriptional regulator